MSEGKVQELHIEQRFISKILDTIDALIIVLDVEGRVVHHFKRIGTPFLTTKP